MLKQELALKDLTAVSLRQLLENLAGARARRDAGEDLELPGITVHLRSGSTVQGWVLRLAQQGSGAQFLLHINSGDPRQPGTSVCYLDLASVEAITVHEAGFHAPLLSFGKARVVHSGPAPSVLDLKRKAQSIGKDLAVQGFVVAVEADWSALPKDDASCFAVDDTLSELGALLKRIAEDPLGRAAIIKLKRVELRAGETFRVQGSEGALTISLQQSPKGELFAPERSELSSSIEGAL